jgi:hypothetical protein
MCLHLAGCLISKGYNGEDAIKIYNGSGVKNAHFKGSMPVYSKSAPNNTRWIPYDFVAFGDVVDRIERMGLDAHSKVTILATPDWKDWDKNDGSGQKTGRHEFIVEAIDFYGGKGGNGNKEKSQPSENRSSGNRGSSQSSGSGNQQRGAARNRQAPPPANNPNDGYDEGLDNEDGFEGVDDLGAQMPFNI